MRGSLHGPEQCLGRRPRRGRADIGLLRLTVLLALLVVALFGGGAAFLWQRQEVENARRAVLLAQQAELLARHQADFALQEAADLQDSATDRASAPAGRYAGAVQALEQFIAREVADKQLPALSIALVDDQTIVWSRGFGFARPKEHIPATAETVYRVGSVSKLFTDLAIMQLVERSALDLDAPIRRYLPDFEPTNPFSQPITLRHLMSHRAGLVREPPVGHYFDPTGPSLAETVASLNRTTLVYAPGSQTKYSNAGIAAAGYVLERTQGEPFARYLQHAILRPLGLNHSSFEAMPALQKDLADALMWSYHGRTFPAPTFALGMAPAGSMDSTVNDLGRFLSVLFAGGQGPEGHIIKEETLQQMWTPQFASKGQKTGFGIGFLIEELDGHRRIGHNGAIYGFATELGALPDDKLGVAVVTSVDCANALARHVADVALREMLAVRQGRLLPVLEPSRPLAAEEARHLAGRYGKEDKGADLSELGGRLYLMPRQGGMRAEVRRRGDGMVLDDRLQSGTPIQLAGDTLVLAKAKYERIPVAMPVDPPTEWAGLIGEYGWDHDTLYILEKDGKLQALIEWFFLYPLEKVSENIFKFPEHGLYRGEKVIFTRDPKGRATQVEAASVVFKRRPIDGEDGTTFKIKPLHPLDELRRQAQSATPPHETGHFRAPDLVDLAPLDPGLKFDIRYATTNNFLSTAFYAQPKAFLQRPAAEALVRAHRRLAALGYGLLIHDAYRPWSVTKMFWEATPEKDRIFVADPAKGSRHNRGCAVDLTLYELKSGKPVAMVGGYDEFSDRSYPGYLGGTSLQRWHRDLLRRVMEAQGFTVYEAEWWHFDYKDWQQYPILNLNFADVKER